MSDSATPWTVAYQAPPSMGFSRQEYWSGLPFPSPVTLKTLATEEKKKVGKLDFIKIKNCASKDALE